MISVAQLSVMYRFHVRDCPSNQYVIATAEGRCRGMQPRTSEHYGAGGMAFLFFLQDRATSSEWNSQWMEPGKTNCAGVNCGLWSAIFMPCRLLTWQAPVAPHQLAFQRPLTSVQGRWCLVWNIERLALVNFKFEIGTPHGYLLKCIVRRRRGIAPDVHQSRSPVFSRR